MKISAKCDYACKALLELALHYQTRQPVQIHVIAERQHIPIKYLVQILIQMKRAGLVASRRGQEGGYQLAKEPNQIVLGEVMRLIDGPLVSLTCLDKELGQHCMLEEDCGFKPMWEDLKRVVQEAVLSITFEDIANKVQSDTGKITYHI
jgi:Rrf2 family protein